MQPALFITDLDNTFVGDDAALAVLQQKLRQWQRNGGTRVVYSTGRSWLLYEELKQEKGLMEPDALVTAVGTEIYWGDRSQMASDLTDPANTPDSPLPDPQWSAQIQVNWDLATVQGIAATLPNLQPQPASEQRPFKASYFVTDPATAAPVIEQLAQNLAKTGVEANVIYSDDRDLDILPQRANKGAAMAFLQAKWGIAPEQTVACGDSGNDQAFFVGDRTKGIIVGNAKPELLHWHQAQPSDWRYLAQAHYAGGILEGLAHFGFA